MEKTLETPPKAQTVLKENNNSQDQNTLSSPNHTNNKNPICISEKTGTPDRLNVPKAFKYIERYTSPTDQMMSPVTRGILARSRKGIKLFPPSIQNQIQESGLGKFRTEDH